MQNFISNLPLLLILLILTSEQNRGLMMMQKDWMAGKGGSLHVCVCVHVNASVMLTFHT